MIHKLPLYGLIMWAAFIIALGCLIGYVALYFSCSDENENTENNSLDILNTVGGFFEGIGCVAGKETTTYLGMGAGVVFGLMYGLKKMMQSKNDDYHY